MQIGYARISTNDQSLDLQIDAINKNGCSKIFSEIASGARTEREQLAGAISYLREGDVLVVWRLDRLGRSLKHLIKIVSDLDSRGIGFCSLQENIDTTTSTGKLFFHIFGAIAEFERDIIRERTIAGLQAARARGRKGGRPRVMDENLIKMAQALYDSKELTVVSICRQLSISRGTFYSYIKKK